MNSLHLVENTPAAPALAPAVAALALSATDAFVARIQNGFISEFSSLETLKLGQNSGMLLAVFQSGNSSKIYHAARVRLSNGDEFFVTNAIKVCDGLIEVSTPFEETSTLMLQVQYIAGVFCNVVA